MVSLFFKILSIFPFQTKGQPEGFTGTGLLIPFYEWRNWGSAGNPTRRPRSLQFLWVLALTSCTRKGGWGDGKERTQINRIVLPKDACKNFLPFGGWCPQNILWRNMFQLERVSWLPSCADLLGARGRVDHSQATQLLFWGKLLVALNLNCMFSLYLVCDLVSQPCLPF